MAAVNIRDTGRNSARTSDVRELATRVQQPSETEAITAANTITAAESGTRYILNVAAAKIQTLPTPAAGLEYWFYVGATEPTGTHTVVTASSANIIVGNISSPEDAAGSVGFDHLQHVKACWAEQHKIPGKWYVQVAKLPGLMVTDWLV